MVEGDDGGATVTADGGKTWTTQYNQSTAQIYRVNSDNQFPYRVYGAQQDNTTVGIASWSSDVGIGIQDWYPVGGGETGFIGTNPDDPELVYSSGPFGQVTEYSTRHGWYATSGRFRLRRRELPPPTSSIASKCLRL